MEGNKGHLLACLSSRRLLPFFFLRVAVRGWQGGEEEEEEEE